ncbi:MAG: hypothetical protein R3F27_09125 [Gammaproteobacteria bacterium]
MLALLATGLCAIALAEPEAAEPQPETADSMPVAGTETPPEDPRIARIEALAAGTLDPDIAPQSLFEVSLADESAIQVEALRVRTLLAAIEAGTDALSADIEALDPALWRGRAALDRARLAFYSLDRAKRDELLALHAARQEAAQPGETDAERRARQAEIERQRSLEAARAARTEAERLVAEELARLISVEARVAAVLADFGAERELLAARRDALLGWQRRVREAKIAGDTTVDTTYEAIRRTLRVSRDELSAALDELAGEGSAVPAIGADALADIPPDIPADHARARRTAVQRAIVEARRAERAIREERAAVLLDEITVLNGSRLELLPFLSASKRNAVTGFTPTGWEQARREVQQLSLILRWHRHTGAEWLAGIRNGGVSGASIWNTAVVAIPWVLVAVLFFWGRPRSAHAIALAVTRFEAADRAERRVSPSLQLQAAHFLGKIHRSLEWALFYLATLWLLPAAAREQLEVQLLSSIVGWGIGGALAVNVINAVVAGTTTRLINVDGGSSRMRLRSLRLVAVTVVVFALILVLSSRLVGQGTIYSWVFSTCWFAAIPVFLVLVSWWRSTIFERIDRIRRKTPVQVWVLSNREGWKSFLAAMIGAVQLFSTGMVKAARLWISDFDLARRAHAWLFRRELERFNEAGHAVAVKPLPDEALDLLYPARECSQWLACPNDDLLEHIAGNVRQGKGGMIALVAPRGMGKSSLMRALHQQINNSISIVCDPHTSTEAVRRAVHTHNHEASQTDAPDEQKGPPLILLDEAHALAKPIIGGLALFDEVIAIARGNCTETTWVFAIDAAVWPFLKRARDARPLFDELHHLDPWDEAQIGSLLAQRTADAGISPVYTGLLDKLPVGADEIDRIDALKAKQGGYTRMLWDHVSGNPGLALEAWRSTLGVDDQGVVHVRPLQEPDPVMLDALPDSTLFILRAVLYLTPATVDDVAQATRLSPEQVLNAFRFAQSQGVCGRLGDRVYIRWSWLRAVTRLLERRHLLVNP